MTASVKTSNANESEHRRELAVAVNNLNLGHSDNIGLITIANGTTSTVVTDTRAHIASVPLLTPTNAIAAALAVYVSARTKNSFTLTHPNPGASATFIYAIVG